MPLLKAGEHQYYYAGDLLRPGLPVIFCHGSGGSHQHWLFQLKGLKEAANPLAVDLPGHGRSGGRPLNTVQGYSDWLHRFKSAAGINKFVLGGHSLGGAITLDYALRYGEHLSALILVGTGARLKVLPAFLKALDEGYVPPALADYLYGPEAGAVLLKSGRQEVLATNPDQYHADLNACNNFDVMEKLPQILPPVLIICGSEDKLTPVKYSKYLHEHLKGSRLKIIKGAGHMVMVEKPEAVNEAAADFLGSLREIDRGNILRQYKEEEKI